MRTVAAVAAMLVVLVVVVVGLRVVSDRYLLPGPEISVERLSAGSVAGRPAAVDVDASDQPSATLEAWLSFPDDFVVQGRVRGEPDDGGELELDVFCVGRRRAADASQTFYDGVADGRGGFTIAIAVTTQRARLCRVNARAGTDDRRRAASHMWRSSARPHARSSNRSAEPADRSCRLSPPQIPFGLIFTGLNVCVRAPPYSTKPSKTS